MSNTSESSTDLSLLSRVRDAADHDAWREFVTRYGRRIFGWCRGWGLQEGDAEDVTQNVLLQVAKQMRNFRYDPTGRCRSWLRRVTY